MSLITKPTKEPVTLKEVKKFCDIEHDDDDLILERLIAAATTHLQTRSEISVVRQQRRLYLDQFCEKQLPLGPVQAIQQVQYIDVDGVTQTLSTAVYEIDKETDYILLAYGQTWPSTRYHKNSVWIDYWCGYFDDASSPIKLVDDIPDDLKVGLMMVVRDLYDNPSKQQEIKLYQNAAFDAMVSPYRRYVK